MLVVVVVVVITAAAVANARATPVFGSASHIESGNTVKIKTQCYMRVARLENKQLSVTKQYSCHAAIC